MLKVKRYRYPSLKALLFYLCRRILDEFNAPFFMLTEIVNNEMLIVFAKIDATI
jgi:hypothetical protein